MITFNGTRPTSSNLMLNLSSLSVTSPINLHHGIIAKLYQMINDPKSQLVITWTELGTSHPKFLRTCPAVQHDQIWCVVDQAFQTQDISPQILMVQKVSVSAQMHEIHHMKYQHWCWLSEICDHHITQNLLFKDTQMIEALVSQFHGRQEEKVQFRVIELSMTGIVYVIQLDL
ncbi:hypothetical protein BDR05DRAFT_952141 [Suillus weaverae]|nr:hypothetical protein BDR05DRAFT_952141 [Suillus weaverae]